MECTGSALIVQHCAVFGRLEKPVRWFKTCEPRPYAQYPVSVAVLFKEPKKRKTYFFTIVPDNLRYLTVEVKGEIVYDSRKDVPCDMGKWQETGKKWEKRPPIFSSHEVV
jgi:hypothetical protein